MDKETIALIIAQNGLGTAAMLLSVKVGKLQKQFDKETDPAKKEALQKQITKTGKLSTALHIANDGITQYQAETA